MNSISFTGHRKLSEDTAMLSQRLYQRLEEEIQNGTTIFNFVGATGWDSAAATVVLQLREVYRHIKVNLILPCSNEDQTEKGRRKKRWSFIVFSNLPIRWSTLLSIIITDA